MANGLVLDFLNKYCIKVRSTYVKAIHNLAFNMFIKTDNYDQLINNLKKLDHKKSCGQAIYLELNYALNLCQCEIRRSEIECA